ncbi:MAG: hypothetical protein WA077_13035, partial [Anaerolineae bacterium]
RHHFRGVEGRVLDRRDHKEHRDGVDLRLILLFLCDLCVPCGRTDANDRESTGCCLGDQMKLSQVQSEAQN